MNKIFLIVPLLAVTVLHAQSRMDSYRMADGHNLQAGDTLRFSAGSVSGHFAHVFYRVGKVQKRNAAFTAEQIGLEWLFIHQFTTRKVHGKPVVYAVLDIPHRPQWKVWVEVEAANKRGEITVNPQKP